MRPTDRFVESVSRLQILIAVKIQSESDLQTSQLLSGCPCTEFSGRSRTVEISIILPIGS